MSLRDTPPFRADHVGSLLRPQRLLDARAKHADGKLDDEELRAVEDDAIREVVRMQEDAGLRTATDGEFRRASWHMDFIYQLGGIRKVQDHLSVKFHSDEGDIEFTPSAARVAERISLPEPIFADAFRFLADTVSDRQTAKLTIPSPSMVHYRGGRAAIDEDVYPDLDEFWSDLTDAYADQVRAIGELGCTYLQFDDTSLAYLNDPEQREHVPSIGGAAQHQHEAYIRHINAALAGRTEGMAVPAPMCKGNFRPSWVAGGGYA